MAVGIQLTPPPRRRDPMVEALMAQASDASPKGHPLAAVAQALQGFLAGKMYKQGNEQQTAQEQAIAEALRAQFAGAGPMQTADTRVAPTAMPASLATPPGAALQPAQDPMAAALMGQPPGQASFQGPAPPPDTRPQAPPLAAAMREAGNPMGEAQALAAALMGQGQGAPYTLSPGQTRFGPNNQPIATVPERERNERTLARDQRIRSYLENFPDATMQDAIKWADGLLRLTVDDKGNRVLTDLTAGGDSRLINIDTGPRPERPPQPPETTDEDLKFDPGEGTGFVSTFLQKYNSTFGQIPFLPVIRGPEEAAQQLRGLERDAIRALATSSRPPIIEQDRISQMVAKPGEWFENPEVATYKTTSFVGLMTDQYLDDLRYMNDPMNPKSEREEASARARAIEGIVRRVMTDDAASLYFGTIRGDIQPGQQSPGGTQEDDDINDLLDRWAPRGNR